MADDRPCEVCGATRTRRHLWRRDRLPDLWACLDVTYCNARKRRAERAASAATTDDEATS